ncbi:MAG: hypothetical protein IT281_02450 [Ignavibacteria bacterium]|nr:hypothetical protein [Ignavibacteria bacterium]MCC7158380.1 hypothetical protein [Ignavibacteria bacterium]
MNFAEKTAVKIFKKQNIRSIKPAGSSFIQKYKIAVYVPLKSVDELTFAMASAGAGKIGKYSVCSFRSTGVGTFMGGEGTSPVVGKKNRFEMVEEVRLEMICDGNLLDKVFDTIYNVHPYEEPACEVYKVLVRNQDQSKRRFVVTLKSKIDIKSILSKVHTILDLKMVPGKISKLKIRKVIFDYSGNLDNDHYAKFEESKNKVLYIRKNKKILNIELK